MKKNEDIREHDGKTQRLKLCLKNLLTEEKKVAERERERFAI